MWMHIADTNCDLHMPRNVVREKLNCSKSISLISWG